VGVQEEKLEEAITKFCNEMGFERDVYLKILINALVDIAKDVELLRAGITSGDMNTIQQISHRIKGASSNLRLNDIVLVATELNTLAKQGQEVSRYPSLYVQIEAAINIYQQALEK